MDGKPMTAKRFMSTRFFVPSICTNHSNVSGDSIRTIQQQQRCVTQRPLKLMLYLKAVLKQDKQEGSCDPEPWCAACNDNLCALVKTRELCKHMVTAYCRFGTLTERCLQHFLCAAGLLFQQVVTNTIYI